MTNYYDDLINTIVQKHVLIKWIEQQTKIYRIMYKNSFKSKELILYESIFTYLYIFQISNLLLLFFLSFFALFH